MRAVLPSRNIPAAVLGFLLLLMSPLIASAQQIEVIVNDLPITSYDIEQRARFLIAAARQPSGEAERNARQELIDEAIRLSAAARVGLEVGDAEVDAAIADIASRANLTADQFATALAQAGSGIETFRQRVRVQMLWGRMVRGRVQAAIRAEQTEFLAAQGDELEGEPTVYDYVLQRIVFTLPADASDGQIAQRRGEAEALRNRFTSCEEGVALARGLNEVAVLEPSRRLAEEIPAGLRDLVADVEVGHLSAPNVTDSGIEVFAVCQRTPATGDVATLQGGLDAEVLDAEGERAAEAFMRELRAVATIIER